MDLLNVLLYIVQNLVLSYMRIDLYYRSQLQIQFKKNQSFKKNIIWFI